LETAILHNFLQLKEVAAGNLSEVKRSLLFAVIQRCGLSLRAFILYLLNFPISYKFYPQFLVHFRIFNFSRPYSITLYPPQHI